MMRLVSVLMILAGFFFTFVLPSLGQFGSDFEITTQRVFPQGEGQAHSFDVELTTADSPVRLDVVYVVENPGAETPASASIPVVINGPSGSVLSQVISFSPLGMPLDGQGTYEMPTFSIFQDGVYTVTVGPVLEDGFNIESIDTRLVGNVGGSATDTAFLGFTLMAVGAFGYVFSGFGRRARRKQQSKTAKRGPWAEGSKTSQIGRGAPKEKPKREPKKTEHIWGRGEDD